METGKPTVTPKDLEEFIKKRLCYVPVDYYLATCKDEFLRRLYRHFRLSFGDTIRLATNISKFLGLGEGENEASKKAIGKIYATITDWDYYGFLAGDWDTDAKNLANLIWRLFWGEEKK